MPPYTRSMFNYDTMARGQSEDQEVKELKKMLRSGRKPGWDSSPMRPCPPALKGLKPCTREPWAVDEAVYNKKFETRDVGTPDRYLDTTARKREAEERRIDYMARFNNKYVAGADAYDGNPFT